MSERTLVVISGGLRSPSSTRLLADRLTEATVAELAARDVTVHVRVVDLREYAHDITNNMLTGFASPALQDVLDTLARADGVIAVTPIFNASYSGLFKSFFDITDEASLVDKPVLIGATGGTARHSLALEHAVRPLFAYLRAVVVSTAVYASAEDWASEAGSAGEFEIRGARSDNGPAHGRSDSALRARIERAARELAGHVVRYQHHEPADPFALTRSFDELLAE
jgi:FMN reductase